MNEGRNHKKADSRIIEYLELKYETDVESGLTTAKVRQRLHKNNISHIAKEKKRIWLICFKQECRNSLFFFFIYLCGASWIFHFSGKMQLLFGLSFLFLLVLNIRRAFRSKKAFFEQKEMKSEKVIVLRDGIFHRIPCGYLLPGDIVRLKKGEKVPENVISLKEPYTKYEAGTLFTENTGRAIVAQVNSDVEQEQDRKETEQDILRELALQHGICLKDLLKTNNNRQKLKSTSENILESTSKKVSEKTIEATWQRFSSMLKKIEEQILESLCIFMLLSLILSLYVPREGDMQRILQTGSLFFVVYIVGKEVSQELFYRWFLKKIKSRKLKYMRPVNKINNT